MAHFLGLNVDRWKSISVSINWSFHFFPSTTKKAKKFLIQQQNEVFPVVLDADENVSWTNFRCSS
jgi:hypothetical protein